jgi:hypothetical protein
MMIKLMQHNSIHNSHAHFIIKNIELIKLFYVPNCDTFNLLIIILTFSLRCYLLIIITGLWNVYSYYKNNTIIVKLHPVKWQFVQLSMFRVPYLLEI